MGKSVNGNAVRIYTLNERATKFRNTAACLSWGEKTGSAEKKAYILRLLPEGATDTRSLGKDLNKQQQEELVAANKGQFPNRRRKAKRTLEAQAPMAIPTPGFQPGASSVGGGVSQSDQSGGKVELSQLGGHVSQHTDTIRPMSFNELSSFGSGSQLGEPQNMLGQGLNLPHYADEANFNGYHHVRDYSSPAHFLAPSQLYPAQTFLNNGGGLSSLNNPRDHSYFGNAPTQFSGMNSFNPAQYGAVSGSPITGGSFPAGAAGGHTNLQGQGDSLLNRPVNAPMQKRKRARAALAEDEAKNSDNRKSKRARTEAPIEAPQETSSPDLFAGGAESLLRFDENGFVIQNNIPVLLPEDFDEFLRDDQHGEEDAEGEDVQEPFDAPVVPKSSNELQEAPAPLSAQGHKRRRSSSTEDVQEVSEGPKSKHPRIEEDVQTPGGSTSNGSEGAAASARPVNVTRGQKRGRGSSESRGETDTSAETPPAKRQKTTPSSDASGTSSGADSSTTDDEPSNKDATSESSSEKSSDDSDGSEYTPSPYHQTSLKSIARPTTGGKGPYNPDGRLVTGSKGKGKGSLKSSRRANMARKTPAKRQ